MWASQYRVNFLISINEALYLQNPPPRVGERGPRGQAGASHTASNGKAQPWRRTDSLFGCTYAGYGCADCSEGLGHIRLVTLSFAGCSMST
jgi:hypothetical protein